MVVGSFVDTFVALNQLDGAAIDSVMEEGSTDVHLNPNSPNPSPMLSPLLIHQFCMVLQTDNDEGQGTDAQVDPGERANAEGAMVDLGNFGDQLDQLECTPIPDVGTLSNASFFPDPVGVSPVSQVQSPSLETDFGTYLFDDGSC